MEKCGSEFVTGECDGFHFKFDSCRDEALWEMALESGDGCGDSDWQGYCTPVTVEGPEPERHQLDATGMGGGPVVLVPAGFYIVHTASTGGVQVWTYRNAEERDAQYGSWQLAYATWDADE